MCPECPAACMTARMICLNQDKNIARKDKHPGPGVDKLGPQCSPIFPEMASRQVELADN